MDFLGGQLQVFLGPPENGAPHDLEAVIIRFIDDAQHSLEVAVQEVDPPERAPDPSLDPATDPLIRRYFEEIKRRIETSWVYPQEALRRHQSGNGVARFMVMQDGRLRHVTIVQSTGSEILDRYMENAIRVAAPFPPVPCKVTEEAVPITMTFTYVLRPSQP